jgi:hypothetical protein
MPRARQLAEMTAGLPPVTRTDQLGGPGPGSAEPGLRPRRSAPFGTG